MKDTDMSIAAKHIIFQGRVQGVGFRYTALRIASGLNLNGYVRNLPDGTVEMQIQGPAHDLEQCIQEIKDYFQSNLRDTKVVDQPPQPSLQDFRIKM